MHMNFIRAVNAVRREPSSTVVRLRMFGESVEGWNVYARRRLFLATWLVCTLEPCDCLGRNSRCQSVWGRRRAPQPVQGQPSVRGHVVLSAAMGVQLSEGKHRLGVVGLRRLSPAADGAWHINGNAALTARQDQPQTMLALVLAESSRFGVRAHSLRKVFRRADTELVAATQRP